MIPCILVDEISCDRWEDPRSDSVFGGCPFHGDSFQDSPFHGQECQRGDEFGECFGTDCHRGFVVSSLLGRRRGKGYGQHHLRSEVRVPSFMCAARSSSLRVSGARILTAGSVATAIRRPMQRISLESSQTSASIERNFRS